MKWTHDSNARPPMHHELFDGRRRVALVRRVAPVRTIRNGRETYRHRYQLVTRFVGIMGDAAGPVFPSLAAAKRAAERAAKKPLAS